ncbi:MAG: SDR family oxidoreductase [Acidimicrobiaceae bacterium]|nr:SDR family oxidoreductase [Acidimicrobiaceae bacterium]MYG98895.1 SDR family oxidoreductase [Acidimicrobiaceae bacterium]MYL05190.1 SDR family oxidoreductase [Acidimicrobiaceae bacterium]
MGTYAISGSASGMGAATRQRLEAAGHRVVGIDLRDAEVIADLGTAEGRAGAVAAVIDAAGGVLDGAVSAAGLGPPVAGDLIARVNFFGSRALLEGLRPALAASGAAQAVQFGSNSSTTTPNLPDDLIAAYLEGREEDAVAIIGSAEPVFAPAIAYGGSKLAITRWCRRAAVTEPWVGEGIRLNVIAPGPVDTPLLRAGQVHEVYGPLMEAFPVPVTETPGADTLAAWVEFLLSPAARFACGSVIYVDGGTDALMRSDDWPRTFTM